MTNEEILTELKSMLTILSGENLATANHFSAVTAVSTLMDSESEAWEMLDELKSSENFGEAFGEFMKNMMGASDLGEA